MPYWKLYYHLVWATKNRLAIITSEHEEILFRVIQQVAQDLESEIFAINGTQDHIHIAATIPPKIAISQWVKRIKGASSYECNQFMTNAEKLRWQRGFGVLTFGKKRLEYVVAYVRNQKQHHAENTIQPYLERVEPEHH